MPSAGTLALLSLPILVPCSSGCARIGMGEPNTVAETVLQTREVEVPLQRFSMTRNERGCLSFAKRVNGEDHDRAVLAGSS
jgi:hypothetical protein